MKKRSSLSKNDEEHRWESRFLDRTDGESQLTPSDVDNATDQSLITTDDETPSSSNTTIDSVVPQVHVNSTDEIPGEEEEIVHSSPPIPIEEIKSLAKISSPSEEEEKTFNDITRFIERNASRLSSMDVQVDNTDVPPGNCYSWSRLNCTFPLSSEADSSASSKADEKPPDEDMTEVALEAVMQGQSDHVLSSILNIRRSKQIFDVSIAIWPIGENWSKSTMTFRRISSSVSNSVIISFEHYSIISFENTSFKQRRNWVNSLFFITNPSRLHNCSARPKTLDWTEFRDVLFPIITGRYMEQHLRQLFELFDTQKTGHLASSDITGKTKTIVLVLGENWFSLALLELLQVPNASDRALKMVDGSNGKLSADGQSEWSPIVVGSLAFSF